MNIAKFVAAAALAAAPVSFASAQSATRSDSGSQHRDGWIAGMGAAAGAGIFLAFTQSESHSAGNSSPGGLHASDGSNGTGQPTSGPIPAPTGALTSTPPPGDSTPSHSTVPEPGTLALTATGIIGLVPLLRRRRR